MTTRTTPGAPGTAMAEEIEQFAVLVVTLLSENNEVRTRAEETYQNIPVERKVQMLHLFICDTTVAEVLRATAAVLLRRLFSSQFMEFYPKIHPEGQAQLKEQILLAVQNEPTPSIRRKICELTAEIARNLIDEDGNNQWPEFLQFLFQCANGPVPALKESALRMFTCVPGVFGNQQPNYLDLIKQMLQLSVNDTSNYEVQFQAVRAICAFIILHDKETNIQKHFAELLPSVVIVTAQSIEKQEDDALLKGMIDLAESTPKFLRPQLEQIMELMCTKVFSNEEMEDSWRQLALEVIVTLAETAPAMVRKVGGKYISALVPLVLKMMTDLDENEEWSISDEIIEEDNDSNNVVAESALDRLACGLGGKTMLPLIAQNINSMLVSTDWKYRHAALMAISAVGEGCHKQMEASLPQIMDGIMQYLQDPHPRVRYAACNAIGQMSTDFAPTFEKKFHDVVIPGLLHVLDDNANPRVQAHAGAALVNFSEDCAKSILMPYLDAIMGKLESILTNKFQELVEKGTKLVLEQVVTTIASVADTCEEQFLKYYDRLMPCLKYIITNATQQEHKLLRGKTIECVSLIGLAVGTEKFFGDAQEVMELLLKSHTDLPEDDPQLSYLISAWARLCKVLGKQFEQYLPLVMGTVMQTAAMKPEVALLDNGDMEDVEGDVDWQFVSLGEQQNFGIKTAGLEDKASACEMLVCYARELKEGFADYAEEVVRLMVPMLKFYFHDGVRTAAAESLPWLLDCAKIKGPQYLEGMWNYICPDLLKAIDTEPEADVLLELLYSLAKCIESLGAGCLNPQSMTELLRILDKLLNEHFEKAVARLEKRKDEDYDDVVEEQLADEDNEDLYTLSKITDIFHALFITHKSSFFPYFDQIVGHFVKLLAPDRSWSDHQWALCVFDDVIEYGGPECAKYQELFLRPMIQYIADKSAEVRQAAAYGCGVLGQYGGETFAQACAEALPRLMEVINDPESRAVENVNPTENAISAVTKILKYNNKAINVDEILPHWLSWLPVVEDEDEAPHVYGYLCDLIEENHPIILGPNNANLPRLISFFAEVFNKDVIPSDNPVMPRILSIIRHIQSNESVFQVCIAVLSSEQQLALHEALSAQPAN